VAGEPPARPPKPLISVAEAARRLGVSESTAYRLAYAGALPGLVRLPGACMRVRARVLDAWLDGQDPPPPPPPARPDGRSGPWRPVAARRPTARR
jgi:excisionase family DNA binding protein